LPEQFRELFRGRSENIRRTNRLLKLVKVSLLDLINDYCSEKEWRSYLLQGLSGLKLKKINPKKDASRRLNGKIRALVDELRRCGFSDQTAYKKTAKLLSLSFSFPDDCKTVDKDIVRQRYTYHSRKK
jgi:hypothetical protein